MEAIDVRELRKHYGRAVAVDGISFAVPAGEIFGLLGPNGAGKTTTVECLLGLRRPDGGRVRLLGLEHDAGSQALRARLGAQLQTTGLLAQLTVGEQVALFAALYAHPLPAAAVLEQVGLSGQVRVATRALSGGQRQRLAVALALVGDPELVFLDEPTAGLDPQARRALWELVRGLKRAGKTVLLTTHYMEEAEQLCDRVAILDHGRIIELDAPEALVNKHFHETAIEFVALGDDAGERAGRLPAVATALRENGRTTLYSTDVPRTMAGLFDLAAAHEFAFKDMTVRQATLEDVFLKLTGRRIRA